MKLANRNTEYAGVKQLARRSILCIPILAIFSQLAVAQDSASQADLHSPVALTLKHVIDLALLNSKDIKIAQLQASLADHSAAITRSQFMPNVSAGSGAGYTYGIPETPGGTAPSLFDVAYTENIFNERLRGEGRELTEQAKSQKILLADTRNTVIVRAAAAYLELGMVRHSLELLRKEQDSAEKILGVTEEREKENLELPVEITKDQLTKARLVQRILQLEGRQDELEVFLRSQTGLGENQPIEVSPEELPGVAEQEGANLVATTLRNNTSLLADESNVRAKEFKLEAEKRSKYPTLQFVAMYSLLSRINNYDVYFKNYQPNNFNAGVQIQLPIFNAQNKASIALAQVNLDVAKASFENKKIEVSSDVRRKTRSLKEKDAAKEVGRLELQLAQQNLAVLQNQFAEGKLDLRQVERARLEENEKWMAYLQSNFQRQQAELDLLKTAGQLDKVFQ
jgi:outer membrane protein TolC